MLDTLVKIYDDFKGADRVQDLRQLAHEYKFDFLKRASFSAQVTGLKGFKVFSAKGSKRFLGIMHQPLEKLEGHIRFYDYWKTKDLETSVQSIIEIRVQDLDTDYLKIEPKGTFSKMKGLFVSQKQEYPEAETFYKNYQISSSTPEAELILQPKALALLANHAGLTIEAEGNHFLFYYKKKKMDIKTIIEQMDIAEDFIELLVFDRSGDFV